MSSRTIFLSKLIGLYCILAASALIAHREASVAMVNELVRNPPMLFILGMIPAAAGLAMVLGHNVWTGGALPVVVTLIGWNTLIKGLLFLFLSPEATTDLLETLHYGQLYYMYAAISMAIGVCLTYAGLATHTRFGHTEVETAFK